MTGSEGSMRSSCCTFAAAAGDGCCACTRARERSDFTERWWRAHSSRTCTLEASPCFMADRYALSHSAADTSSDRAQVHGASSRNTARSMRHGIIGRRTASRQARAFHFRACRHAQAKYQGPHVFQQLAQRDAIMRSAAMAPVAFCLDASLGTLYFIAVNFEYFQSSVMMSAL